MPVATKFATGKHANALCDVCGGTVPYLELRVTTIRGRRTGILACARCWDPDHPQNFLPEALVVDAIALRNPRPDDFATSRRSRTRRVEVRGLVLQLHTGGAL